MTHFHWVHTQKWVHHTSHTVSINHSLHRSSLALFYNSCRRRLGQCVCQWAKMNNKINSIISIMPFFLAIITIIRFSTSLKVRLTLHEKKHSCHTGYWIQLTIHTKPHPIHIKPHPIHIKPHPIHAKPHPIHRRGCLKGSFILTQHCDNCSAIHTLGVKLVQAVCHQSWNQPGKI